MEEVLLQPQSLAVSLPGGNGLWCHLLRSSVGGVQLWQLLVGRLTGTCCNEVMQVMLSDTIVVLICAVTSRGIWVNVNLTNPEWMCRVGLMSRASQDPNHR